MVEIIDIVKKVLKTGHVCNHCFGRCFAQLMSGFTNSERGAAIRLVLVMAIDSGEKADVDMSNFSRYKFRQQKFKIPAEKTCWVCSGLFDELDKVSLNASKKMKKLDFSNFQVGVILSKQMIQAEEKLWETAGIEWCESIKSELSREIGKRISDLIKKEVEMKNPEIVVVINFAKNKFGQAELAINPIFIYGKYKKFAEMPQTRWPCSYCRGKGCKECDFTGKMYATSIEERIGKTFLLATKGNEMSFHGAGREDIDVRCLDWREFIMELKEPSIRSFDMKKIEKKINKQNKGKISVSCLRLSNKDEVRAVKERNLAKTYRAIVMLKKDVAKKDLAKLKRIKGTITQRTPARVVHRRADITRKRNVLAIRYKLVGKKKLILEIKAQAGLYIKELITGDNNRTRPSVAEILAVPLKLKKLEIIKIG